MLRDGRFRRSDRLLQRRDFQRVAREGRRVSSRSFVILVAPTAVISKNSPRCPRARRLGITVSRKVGNAVVRNRVKRGVREWFQHQRELLVRGIDLVVIARPDAARLKVHEIHGVLSCMLELEPGRVLEVE